MTGDAWTKLRDPNDHEDMAQPLFSQGHLALRVASILSSSIVVAVALLLYLKHRHMALLHFATFLGCALFIGSVSFLGGLGWHPPFLVGFAIEAALLPVVAGLCISLPTFVLSLLTLKPPTPARLLLWLPAPTLLVAMGIQIATYLHQGLTPLNRVTNLLCTVGFIWFFVEWIACCILIAVDFRRITQPEVRLGILGMALVMVAWIPFWVYEVVNHSLITSPYIFALIWSFLSLALAVRHFFQPALEPGVTAASLGPLADGPMLDRFAKARKLTPRERELCGLLVEGLNHVDIAEQLFISEKTVRNHVSNIYAKVGVSSRMELIHLIRTA